MDKLPALFPYLVVSDGTAAIAFYKNAFGAVEDEPPYYAPGTKKLMNARMSIRGAVFMLCDDFTSHATPEALGGTPVMLHLNFDQDVDEAFARGVSAGAVVKVPLEDMFWGDRYGQLTDPFGHIWAMGQKIAKPTKEELDKGAAAAVESMK